MTISDMTNTEITEFLLSRCPCMYQPWWGFNPEHKHYKSFENRLNLILPEIKLNGNKKLIDIGCYIGWNTFALNNKETSITGVDINKTSIELAQFLHDYHNLDKNHISFIRADASEFLQTQTDTYDYCICFNVMHHYLADWSKENKRDTSPERSVVFKPAGIKFLKSIQSNCKIAFFQIRLRYPDLNYKEKEDNKFITYLINEIGFKSYKILQTENNDDYFRSPNPIYMFNN